MDEKVKELTELRDDLLRKADAIDYCIRMLQRGGSESMEQQIENKPKRKKKAGNTQFTIESRTEPAVIPNHDDGILIWDGEPGF